MAVSRVRLIINPSAGAGTARRMLPRLIAAMNREGISFELAMTSGPGDATRIARTSFEDGLNVLVAVGGDGTLNEVVQAYLGNDGEARPGPKLGLIPIGTGGDFRRTLQLPPKIEDAVHSIKAAHTVSVDLGIMDLQSHEGEAIRRAFINVTSFGVGGLTDKLVNETPKWLGGKASFLLGATRAALRYRNAPVRISLDGEEIYRGPLFNGVIANGRFFGGGMLVAPNARANDGMFDVIVFGNISFAQSLNVARTIYSGQHVNLPHVKVFQGKELHAAPLPDAPPVLLDMDGETPGRLPIRVHIVPAAIEFIR